jgi:hypothetical protein
MTNLPPPTVGRPLIISRHLLRRTARKQAARLDRLDPSHNYSVQPAKRGPVRWYCIRLPRNPLPGRVFTTY